MSNYLIEEENAKLEKARALAQIDYKKESIGLLMEHTLHRVIKFYIDNDPSHQEIKIGKMFADVFVDNSIYEVQTKSFNAMRGKLNKFLEAYEVTIVHPMASSKIIYISNEVGELVKQSKSPRHVKPLEIFAELYKIKEYLLNPKLHFKIIMCEMVEFRSLTKKTHYHSRGVVRTNQIPTKIMQVIDIKEPLDFKQLLDKEIKEPFTSKDFKKVYHLSLKHTGMALNVLTYLNVLKRVGKEKNSYLYEIV